MALSFNKISNIFGKGSNKKKTSKIELEDEEVKPPVRKYSLSKSGRMRARDYSRATLVESKVYKNNEEQKRKKSQESITTKKDDEENINIEEVLKEMQNAHHQ